MALSSSGMCRHIESLLSRSTPIPGTVFGLAFTPDGKRLVSSGWDSTVRLWAVDTHRLIDQPLVGHRGPVYTVATSNDGSVVTSGSSDYSVIIWKTASQHPLSVSLPASLKHEDVVRSVAFSPDGRRLATAGGKTVILWDVAARKAAGTPMTEHSRNVMAVSFSPDGKLLASCGQDGLVIIRDSETRKPIKRLTGTEAYINSIAFSPDGKLLASVTAGGEARVWDVATYELVSKLGGDPLEQVTFSRDGRLLALAGQDDNGGLVRILEAKKFGTIAELIAGSEPIKSAAFSPDGRMLAAGGNDSVIRIWDTGNSKVATTLVAHKAPVFSVAWSPDGTTLVSAGVDGTIILWDVASRRTVGRPMQGGVGTIFSVIFSPDGRRIAVGGENGVPTLWDIDPQSWQLRACSTANRPFSPNERSDHMGTDWLEYLKIKRHQEACPG